jgi:outer membrane protein assembly factor BamB
MKRSLSTLVSAALITVLGAAKSSDAEPARQSVLTYHADPSRSGNFIVPSLTWDRASSLQLDGNFAARISGHVYAQPLYWRSSESTSGTLLVATEGNVVHAVDAVSGQVRWQHSLGKPVPRSSLPCGNISPLGVTGTPVVDAAREAIYLDAAVESASGPRHLVFAVSVTDGTPLPGWPIDVMETLGREGQNFGARDQNQRGALAILAGNLYVPFRGHFGDCGQYRGFVLGISLSDPRTIRSWAARARGGGIWAPGGVSTDGTSLFVATGNTFGTRTWSDGEAVIRLAPDLHRSDDKRDFFAPTNWAALDARDVDLGGSNPLPLEVSGGSQPLILALGKDGKAYLLDRNNLGGIGGQLAMETVSDRAIITAPVTYPAAEGSFVAVQAEGTRCPTAARGLLTLKIRPVVCHRPSRQPGVDRYAAGALR